MIPMQLLPLEHDTCYDGEDSKRDDLLNDLELHEGEWTTIAHKTHLVGWHLKHVLEEGDCPREEYHEDKWPRCGDVHLV